MCGRKSKAQSCTPEKGKCQLIHYPLWKEASMSAKLWNLSWQPKHQCYFCAKFWELPFTFKSYPVRITCVLHSLQLCVRLMLSFPPVLSSIGASRGALTWEPVSFPKVSAKGGFMTGFTPGFLWGEKVERRGEEDFLFTLSFSPSYSLLTLWDPGRYFAALSRISYFCLL